MLRFPNYLAAIVLAVDTGHVCPTFSGDVSSFVALMTHNVSLTYSLVMIVVCSVVIRVIILDGRPCSWCVIITVSTLTVILSSAKWSIGKSGSVVILTGCPKSIIIISRVVSS